MKAPRGLQVTFSVTLLLALGMAILLAWPGGRLMPVRRVTFELDEPPPGAPPQRNEDHTL